MRSKKSTAGRKPLDAIMMFRMLVLQSLYNLSDEQIEYQVRDRLSFTRFLGRGVKDRHSRWHELWLFREKLTRAGLIESKTVCPRGEVARPTLRIRGLLGQAEPILAEDEPWGILSIFRRDRCREGTQCHRDCGW